jgi:hypothetical protein
MDPLTFTTPELKFNSRLSVQQIKETKIQIMEIRVKNKKNKNERVNEENENHK